MAPQSPDVSDTLIDELVSWLRRAALKGADLETLCTGTFERLSAAGMPLLRAHVGFSMLHPLYDALSFTWTRGKGVEVVGHQRGGPENTMGRYEASPFYFLLKNGLGHLRRRLDTKSAPEFPVFEELVEAGGTDYLAFLETFDGDGTRGMMGSWTTDQPLGFSEQMIRTLVRVESNFAVATKMAVLDKLADNMLSTYLGGDAGRRVLSGQTKRGDGETIRAVLVMGDMRNSTSYAEDHGRQVYIETLNEFFDAIAAPFNRNGGEILSFIGDGFLAIYPCDRHMEASEVAAGAAFNAVREAVARMDRLNTRRSNEGLSTIGYGIGLHVGNVMFGNVGLKNRLTFSTFGSAVNEVQRLETLTKAYRKTVIASDDFAQYAGGDWEVLGTEALRGTQHKVTLHTPSAAALACSGSECDAEDLPAVSSDAENVMRLYRTQPRRA
jgi:adenylate cyclase